MTPIRKTSLCKSHPDFHMPAHVEIGEGFDGEAYAQRLKASGADAVVIFAKCHYGFAYYPSQYGTVHPHLRTDMVAEVQRGCEKHGLRFIVYFSVFLDTAAAEKHPAWRLAASDTSTDAGFDSKRFEPICVNSGYLEELMIPQTREVIERYRPDELFYDTMTGFHPCGCETCVKAYGKCIPESPDDADWLDYVAWYKGCFDRFFERLSDAVHAADSNVGVSINWAWGIRNPESPPKHVTRLAADLIPTPRIASTVCRYFAGTGLPFDYMTGRFLHGLGDWNNNTADSLLVTAASTASNGGSFYIIDRQLPDGSLEERGYQMMRDVFGFLQDRRDIFEDTRHVPETAVLHSFDHIMGDRLQYYPLKNERDKRREPFEGVCRFLTHHGRHYTAYNLQNLLARMNEHRLVIIPETEYLCEEFVGELAAYVKQGGNMLTTLPASLEHVPPALLDLCGAECNGESAATYGYIATEGKEPILVRAPFHRLRPAEGAASQRAAITPAGQGASVQSFGHGFAPPGEPDGGAAMILAKHGKGFVITYAFPAFGSYWSWRNPWLADMLLANIDRLQPDPIARAHTRAQVELVSVRRGDDLIIHLVNHSAQEFLGGYYYPHVEYVPVIPDLTVSLSPRIKGRTVRLHRTGEILQPIERDGRLFLENLRLHHHEALVLTQVFRY